MTVALHFQDSGEGIPLVLLHAFPLSGRMWANQRATLSDSCRVITPDLRGFGRSPAGADEPALEAMADDVFALLDRLDLGSVVLGGLSMGGYVAMAMLRKYPQRIAALVLADTKATADTAQARANRERLASTVVESGTVEALYDQVLPTLLGRSTKDHRPEVVAEVRGLIGDATPSGVAWAARAMAARPDSIELLESARVPALVIVGDEDQIASVADAEAMADALPKVTMARLMAAGHLSAMEDPRAFNAAVRDFVAGLT
ncbi:alpha/beta hydrolase [Fodinicola feengrottensis]|uniref:Alpha/beta hydrolase n=2 Tax=Fodinicola feengrottensis TaxID=435914 RepID=A0ABN2FU90_9ACTN